jgi:hypothetical protein
MVMAVLQTFENGHYHQNGKYAVDHHSIILKAILSPLRK